MSVLRCLAGRILDCGCLIGVYEEYDGSVITVIDARGPACESPEHTLHARLPADRPRADAPESDRRDRTARRD
jgi:hypothetical protein